ncbi:uncharacterized protein ACWYII_040815 isoform 2-T2 [Salvelinus alpinus]
MAQRELKMCLPGDTGVGKSSIVWRFVEDSFDPNINPTIGASFMTKTVQYELHKFLIWDTAGQERPPSSLQQNTTPPSGTTDSYRHCLLHLILHSKEQAYCNSLGYCFGLDFVKLSVCVSCLPIQTPKGSTKVHSL